MHTNLCLSNMSRKPQCDVIMFLRHICGLSPRSLRNRRGDCDHIITESVTNLGCPPSHSNVKTICAAPLQD